MSGRGGRTFGGNRRANRQQRLSIESLESRLLLTWAGTPPVTIGVPTSAVAIVLNAQNDASGAASIATTEVDYYSFTAGSSGSYVISSTTPASSLDTVLGLFSSSGQRLAYNDDITYPSNTDSRVTLNLTSGSRYYLGVTNYASSSRGSYSWSIDGPAPAASDDAYENNDTLATAYNLGTPTATTTVNNLVMADAHDWYRFTTSATGTSSNTVSISFQNSQGNLQLALYDSAGTLLTSSQGTGNTETVSLSGRAAGTYYIDVFGNAGATNPSYALSIVPPIQTTPPPTGGFQITVSSSGLTTSQQAIFQQAANRWAQVITGDLPNATYNGQTVDDLLINASSVTIDGVGGILGQAGPDAFRSGSRLPYHGIMQFDSADMASMQSQGLLFSVVLHEMGHVLGIGTLWQSLGLLSGSGTSNPIFVGAEATSAYNQIFSTSATGVPVESGGGSGTANAHWRETVFTTELMTGWAGPGTNLPLSRVTAASLADMGYSVNIAAADSFTPSSSALTNARQTSGGSASLRSFSDRFSNSFWLDGALSSIAAATPASGFATFGLHGSPALPVAQVTVPVAHDHLKSDAVDSVMAEWRELFSVTSRERIGHRRTPTDCLMDNVWTELAEFKLAVGAASPLG